RRYSDVFPYDDFRAELQEVKLLVGDEPFVVSFRSNRKHQVDYTSVKWAGSNCCNQTRTDNTISTARLVRLSVTWLIVPASLGWHAMGLRRFGFRHPGGSPHTVPTCFTRVGLKRKRVFENSRPL